MTEMPAKTPRPIGSTESFFPGRVKAAAAEGVDDDSTAAADAADWSAGAAEGVGTVAGAEVAGGAAEVAGAGTLDVLPTTGPPVAAADAEVEDADGAGTDDMPITTIPDAESLGVAEAEVADEVADEA